MFKEVASKTTTSKILFNKNYLGKKTLSIKYYPFIFALISTQHVIKSNSTMAIKKRKINKNQLRSLRQLQNKVENKCKPRNKKENIKHMLI